MTPSDHPAVPGWVIALPECPSTNTWALDHLDDLQHGHCVWTQRQSAGRGRSGSAWFAPPGVLTASFVCDLGRADDPLLVAPTRLSLAAGLAAALAVTEACPGIVPGVKWPNDLVLGGRKLAGVLCEHRTRRDGRPAVIVGIGLNLAPRWELDPNSLPLASGKAAPIGLDEVTSLVPDALTMLDHLRRFLHEGWGLLAANGWARLLPGLRARDCLRGQSVRVQTGTGLISGHARGLADDGCLLIDTGGAIMSVASGHVSAWGDVA